MSQLTLPMPVSSVASRVTREPEARIPHPEMIAEIRALSGWYGRLERAFARGGIRGCKRWLEITGRRVMSDARVEAISAVLDRDWRFESAPDWRDAETYPEDRYAL